MQYFLFCLRLLFLDSSSFRTSAHDSVTVLAVLMLLRKYFMQFILVCAAFSCSSALQLTSWYDISPK